jgi:hypothetical protein
MPTKKTAAELIAPHVAQADATVSETAKAETAAAEKKAKEEAQKAADAAVKAAVAVSPFFTLSSDGKKATVYTKADGEPGFLATEYPSADSVVVPEKPIVAPIVEPVKPLEPFGKPAVKETTTPVTNAALDEAFAPRKQPVHFDRPSSHKDSRGNR